MPAVNVAEAGPTMLGDGAKATLTVNGWVTLPFRLVATIPQGRTVPSPACVIVQEPTNVASGVPLMVAVPSPLSLNDSAPARVRPCRESLGTGNPVVVTRKFTGTPAVTLRELGEVM